MLVDREDECDPKAKVSWIVGHGSVAVVESLGDPGGHALAELVEKGLAGGDEFVVGLWGGDDVIGNVLDAGMRVRRGNRHELGTDSSMRPTM
jgi:hypothetical protein